MNNKYYITLHSYCSMEVQKVLGQYEEYYINRASELICKVCGEQVATWDYKTSNEVKQFKRDHRRICK